MADLPIGSDDGAPIVEVIQASTQNKLAITAANAAKVDGSAVTQPVSGTVTSNQGTAAGASGSWPIEITDGTNVLGVSAHPLFENLSQVGGTAIALGQTTMSASIPVAIASDQSVLKATLGNSTGKTVVMKTGSLVTTAVTADQVVLTRTVTTGKTFYLQYLEMTGRQTTPSGGTSIVLGTISLELPSGTKVISDGFIGGGATSDAMSNYTFAEPIPVTSTTVIRVVVTPAATSSMTWFANFGGYEV